MPGLIHNITNISIDNINNISNSSTPIDFIVKINHVVYDGYLWFVLLFLILVITFIAQNQVKDAPARNLLYSSAFVTLLSFILRGIYIIENGVFLGLITDHQLWVFPIITLLTSLYILATKD